MGNLKFCCSIIIAGFLLVACVLGDTSKLSEARIVAVAGNSELDMDTYRENFFSTGFIKDSLYNAKKSIESWATESLFYQEAMEKLGSADLSIEREVEAYRRTLVNYIYQSRLTEANLDTVVTNEEIEAYYDSHRENFILKDNILKVDYIKVPVKAAGVEKIRKLAGTKNPKETEQLKLLCVQNAENFFLNDSTWLFLDDVKKEIPALKDEPDFNLSPGRLLEFSDEMYYYYLRVKDVKVKNGLSPLNFERNNITKFILNQRKTQLVSQYKKLLLEKAKEDKKFIIY
jgi:hypothetical protein